MRSDYARNIVEKRRSKNRGCELCLSGSLGGGERRCGAMGGRWAGIGNLYDDAFLGFAGSSKEGCAGCVFKDFPDAIVQFGGTFEIPGCSNLTSDGFTL